MTPYDFLLKYNLPRVSCLDDLQPACKNYNTQILSYQQGKAIIKENKIQAYAKKVAFLWRMGDINIIFYDGRHKRADTLFAVCHELAHLILDHTDGSDREEDAADYWAITVIAPAKLLRSCGVKNTAEVQALTGLTGRPAALAVAALAEQKSNQPAQVYKTKNKSYIRQKILKRKKVKILFSAIVLLCTFTAGGLYIHNQCRAVYVTVAGTRYHTNAACYHIARCELHTLATFEATRLGYLPCKDCSNGQNGR